MNMGTPKYLSKVSKDDESHLPNRGEVCHSSARRTVESISSSSTIIKVIGYAKAATVRV